MTPSVDKLIPWTDALDLRVTTLTESYSGVKRQPGHYPRPKGILQEKDGYACLTLSSKP